MVAGHEAQAVALVAEVFHELAGLFDRIPFDAVNPGDAVFADGGQHVVQAVAEFVEKGGDFLVGEAGLLVADRRGEVADEVSDRQLQRIIIGKAGDGTVHPRAAAFFRARVGVKVEAGA